MFCALTINIMDSYESVFSVIMEFFLNRAELSVNSANSGNLKITEA